MYNLRYSIFCKDFFVKSDNNKKKFYIGAPYYRTYCLLFGKLSFGPKQPKEHFCRSNGN